MATCRLRGTATADGCGTKATKITRITNKLFPFVIFVNFLIFVAAAVARLTGSASGSQCPPGVRLTFTDWLSPPRICTVDV